jgi:hypothetical protein
MAWTTENTEGFSDAELAVLNEAQAVLENETGLDPSTVTDLLNNAWTGGGNTVETLCASVRARLARS